MTRFTVVWQPELRPEFIREWMAADSPLRTALTRASDWVDRHLVVDPEKQGRAMRFNPAYRSVLVPGTGKYAIVVLYQVIT